MTAPVTNPAQLLKPAGGPTVGSRAWAVLATLAVAFVILPTVRVDNALGQQGGASETFDRVPLLPPAADLAGQGFVRMINHSDAAGTVHIHAIDDYGLRYGPVSVAIGARQTVHFNSRDLEVGNAAKGFAQGVGPGQGHWRLEVASDVALELLAYVRSNDGLLTSMHDLVNGNAINHRVLAFNPASNLDQRSRLRLINSGDEVANVTIAGVDDGGNSPGVDVNLVLQPGTSRMVTADELESGAGIDGALGDGVGKWQLYITSDRPIEVMNLLKSRGGHLSNLSNTRNSGYAFAEPGEQDKEFPEVEHSVPLFSSGSDPHREGFVRIINHARAGYAVGLDLWQDDGQRGYGGFGVQLQVHGNATVHLNSNDLRQGNPDKGLSRGIGPSDTPWRMDVSYRLNYTNSPSLEVLAFVRAPDGFLSNMLQTVPRMRDVHRVPIFNPASNHRQVSQLRLINRGGQAAAIAIHGIDDAGARTGEPVRLSLPAWQVRTLTALQLENGAENLNGALGDGVGKWQLHVQSDVPIEVMNLLASPTGHLTNLSTAPMYESMVAGTSATGLFQNRIAGPIVQSNCIDCHTSNGVASATRLTFAERSNPDHLALNQAAFAGFLADVEDGAREILDKVQDTDHGHGAADPLDAAEAENLRQFLQSLEQEAQATATDAGCRSGAGVSAHLPAFSYYRLVGEHKRSRAGSAVAPLGDVDCDGALEFLVGAEGYGGYPGRSRGAVYVVSTADLDAVDSDDGVADQVVDLFHLVKRRKSSKIIGFRNHRYADALGYHLSSSGTSAPVSQSHFVIPGQYASYVLSAANVNAADAADGTRDGLLNVRQFKDQYGSWELPQGLSSSAAFVDGGHSEGPSGILVGFAARNSGVARSRFQGGESYFLRVDGLASLDARDGEGDGSIDLGSNPPDGVWVLSGAASEERSGQAVADVGDIDGDGLSDFAIAAPGHRSESGEAGALYVVAVSDLATLDAKDGEVDYNIDLANVGAGAGSWKLVGESAWYLSSGDRLASADIDDDGRPELIYAADRTSRGESVYIVSVADLPDADRADGTADRQVRFAHIVDQPSSYRLLPEWPGSRFLSQLSLGYFPISVGAGAIDGDGTEHILVGTPHHSDDEYCLTPTRRRLPGAMYLISGDDLASADAADGQADGAVQMANIAARPGSWKIVGEDTDRIGGSVAVAGDLDGDGKGDILAGAPLSFVPVGTDCEARDHNGVALLISTANLEGDDAADGVADGVIHLDHLRAAVAGDGSPQPPVIEPAPELVTVHDERVVVMRIATPLQTTELDFGELAAAFYSQLDDAFDFLLVLSNLPTVGVNEVHTYAGTYLGVQNSIEGTGQDSYSRSSSYGSQGRLKGIIHLPYNDALLKGPSLHEIMHAWANFVIPTTEPFHWGFSSANGQLGGFDPDKFVELGDNRYSAGSFSTYANGGNGIAYSPIELYLAGLIAPEHVPDLWFAEDGAWLYEGGGLRQDELGNPVFTASQTATWSIEEIVQRIGARVPDVENSQKDFRAALVLLVDERYPGHLGTLQELSEAVEIFSRRGDDADPRTINHTFNFWEATGGRATLTMDGLSGHRHTVGTSLFRPVVTKVHATGSHRHIVDVHVDEFIEGTVVPDLLTISVSEAE